MWSNFLGVQTIFGGNFFFWGGGGQEKLGSKSFLGQIFLGSVNFKIYFGVDFFSFGVKKIGVQFFGVGPIFLFWGPFFVVKKWGPIFFIFGKGAQKHFGVHFLFFEGVQIKIWV